MKSFCNVEEVSHLISSTQLPSSPPPPNQSTNIVKDFGHQKSSVKQGVLNPVWNEDFQFSNIPSLNNMVLTLKVMDSDIGSRDDKCGKCKIKLEHEGISISPKRFTKTVDCRLLWRN